VRELKANPDLFELLISVESKGNRPLVDGQLVTFYLPPTIRPAIVLVGVKNGKATLKRYAWGAFTVGAVIQDDKLKLELDLSELQDASLLFRSR
jgi:hypothetical protein